MKFKVAGHIFQIKGTQLYKPVADRIGMPYGPFAVSENDLNGADPLFVLELQSEEVRWNDQEAVFTNKDTVEPGYVVISVYKDEGGHHFEFSQSASSQINGRLTISLDYARAWLSL